MDAVLHSNTGPQSGKPFTLSKDLVIGCFKILNLIILFNKILRTCNYVTVNV